MDETGNLVAADFAAQLKQAFANLRAALAAVGATPEEVVKITVLSVDHDAEKQQLISATRNQVWSGDRKPTSTLIPVPRLAVEGLLFEIDAVAAIPNS
ncbi:RidA family protein [Nostoc sp. KVJ20]|uniref:RidA family protein n=2 Tax=unclassified Nostoc TaxID=2593658 RepID=UPI001C4075B8|nr:RidA family protein [Nostoc sp. KVJ20]